MAKDRELARAEALEYGTGWRVVGVVNDTDQCEHCGRRGLKRVVAMVPLDADGNDDGDAAFFGTGCAVGYIKRGTMRGKATGAAVWTAALVAERERVERQKHAGEILVKYGHVTDFDPIQKAAIFYAYNPSCASKGTEWGAGQVDWFVSEANRALEGVSAALRAQYIEMGRKALGLPERTM